ncbi:hypothetical protein SESBI_17605 [Sesbania bispinosa]|nr:hypothetical protein SESBI_17605 [Sesbania bispinosa]
MSDDATTVEVACYKIIAMLKRIKWQEKWWRVSGDDNGGWCVEVDKVSGVCCVMVAKGVERMWAL